MLAAKVISLLNVLQTCAGASRKERRSGISDCKPWKVDTERREKGGSATDLKFEGDHLDEYSKLSIHWPPTPEQFAAAGLAGKYEHLPRRYQDPSHFQRIHTQQPK